MGVYTGGKGSNSVLNTEGKAYEISYQEITGHILTLHGRCDDRTLKDVLSLGIAIT